MWKEKLKVNMEVKTEAVKKESKKEFENLLEEDFKKFAGSYYSPFKIKKLLEEIDDLIEKNNYSWS